MNTVVTPKQQAFWDENGYLISDLVLEDAVLEDMREHMERVFNGMWVRERPYISNWGPGSPEDAMRQMAFAWRLSPVLEASALTPEIGEIAAQLVSKDSIRLLMDWIVHKPGVGDRSDAKTGVGFHQDHGYWLETWPRKLLTARIPLDHETEDNGCMWVVPGSHKMELLPGMGDGFWIKDESGLDLGGKFDISNFPDPVSCELQPGQIMFHHCMTIHGTGQNRTNKPRRSQNVHMMPGDTVYRAGHGACFSGFVAAHGKTLRDGQTFGGNLFPEIWSRETAEA